MWLYGEFHATLIWNAGYLYTVFRCLEEDIKQLDAYPKFWDDVEFYSSTEVGSYSYTQYVQ